MTALLRAQSIIDAINDLVGRAASWLVLAAVLISAINATTRKLFDLSSNAWLEAQWYLFSAVFLLSAGYTLLNNAHVKVDILHNQLSRQTQLWIEILGTVLFLLPLCLVAVHLSWPIVLAKLLSGEVSNNTGGLVLWPAWALLPVGFLLLALQGISELIKRVAILRGIIPDLAAASEADPNSF